MLSKNQEEIINKIKIVVDNFLRDKKTISEIEKETGISSSSIQRYLNDEENIREIYGIDADFIIEEIQRRLKQNKEKGLSKGGINFAKNNISTKDELGHFTGSVRK